MTETTQISLALRLVRTAGLDPYNQAAELLKLCPKCWDHPKPCNCHEHPLIAADEENG